MKFLLSLPLLAASLASVSAFGAGYGSGHDDDLYARSLLHSRSAERADSPGLSAREAYALGFEHGALDAREETALELYRRAPPGADGEASPAAEAEAVADVGADAAAPKQQLKKGDWYQKIKKDHRGKYWLTTYDYKGFPTKVRLPPKGFDKNYYKSGTAADKP